MSRSLTTRTQVPGRTGLVLVLIGRHRRPHPTPPREMAGEILKMNAAMLYVLADLNPALSANGFESLANRARYCALERLTL